MGGWVAELLTPLQRRCCRAEAGVGSTDSPPTHVSCVAACTHRGRHGHGVGGDTGDMLAEGAGRQRHRPPTSVVSLPTLLISVIFLVALIQFQIKPWLHRPSAAAAAAAARADADAGSVGGGSDDVRGDRPARRHQRHRAADSTGVGADGVPTAHGRTHHRRRQQAGNDTAAAHKKHAARHRAAGGRKGLGGAAGDTASGGGGGGARAAVQELPALHAHHKRRQAADVLPREGSGDGEPLLCFVIRTYWGHAGQGPGTLHGMLSFLKDSGYARLVKPAWA